jgi:hypothetical protein
MIDKKEKANMQKLFNRDEVNENFRISNQEKIAVKFPTLKIFSP